MSRYQSCQVNIELGCFRELTATWPPLALRSNGHTPWAPDAENLSSSLKDFFFQLLNVLVNFHSMKKELFWNNLLWHKIFGHKVSWNHVAKGDNWNIPARFKLSPWAQFFINAVFLAKRPACTKSLSCHKQEKKNTKCTVTFNQHSAI